MELTRTRSLRPLLALAAVGLALTVVSGCLMLRDGHGNRILVPIPGLIVGHHYTYDNCDYEWNGRHWVHHHPRYGVIYYSSKPTRSYVTGRTYYKHNGAYYDKPPQHGVQHKTAKLDLRVH